MNLVRKSLVPFLKTIRFYICQSKIQNQIGFIYMNGPNNNALTTQMKSALVQNVKQFELSSEVKVMVLLSKDEKAFCGGAQIKDFQNKSSKDFENNDIFKEIHDTFYSAKKPIIAGVNGVAVSEGCQLSLLCDLIYCSEQAKFRLRQLQIGLIPGFGGTQRLSKLIGRANAMQYIQTSRQILAPKAKQLGLVIDVFKTGLLQTQVTKIATQITKKPLQAILAAKQCVKQTQNLSMIDGVALERKIFYPLCDTAGINQEVATSIQKITVQMLNL